MQHLLHLVWTGLWWYKAILAIIRSSSGRSYSNDFVSDNGAMSEEAAHATWRQMLKHVRLRDLFQSLHLTFPVNVWQCKAPWWCCSLMIITYIMFITNMLDRSSVTNYITINQTCSQHLTLHHFFWTDRFWMSCVACPWSSGKKLQMWTQSYSYVHDNVWRLDSMSK